MESFLSRYRNLIVLLAILLGQVIGLAVQVRKPRTVVAAAAGASNSASLPGGMGLPGGGGALPNAGRDRADGPGVRLIRLWASDLVTPFERGIHGSAEGVNALWANYIDLRKTKQENRELQQTIDRLRLEQATLLEDAKQGERLQEIAHFRQNYIYQTLPAQVIGTSGSNDSHVIWIDKGAADGLAVDMAVITGDGIVGKVRDVFPHTAQVLVINDQTSGAGVVLETTRTRGILRGNADGQPQVINILADQRIKAGERVLTAGGDQVFPRGLPVGEVERVAPDPERGSFIDVIVKPAAKLQHLDEVLVITSLDAHLSPKQRADLATSEELKGAEVAAEAERKKAAAEMGERLPGLHDAGAAAGQTGQTGQAGQAGQAGPGGQTAAAAGQAKGPDGKPIVAPLVAPKPLPAKHADRFSPGGSPGRESEARPGVGDVDGHAAGGGDAGTKPKVPVRSPSAGNVGKPKPALTGPELAKPAVPKPAVPKPAVPRPAVPRPDNSAPGDSSAATPPAGVQ